MGLWEQSLIDKVWRDGKLPRTAAIIILVLLMALLVLSFYGRLDIFIGLVLLIAIFSMIPSRYYYEKLEEKR